MRRKSSVTFGLKSDVSADDFNKLTEQMSQATNQIAWIGHVTANFLLTWNTSTVLWCTDYRNASARHACVPRCVQDRLTYGSLDNLLSFMLRGARKQHLDSSLTPQSPARRPRWWPLITTTDEFTRTQLSGCRQNSEYGRYLWRKLLNS